MTKPVSRNFRKLRLNIQHPTQSICSTQKDRDSPDWACRTCRAIEAEATSMRNVYRHRQDSTPRHILDAMCSTTKICSPDGRRVQSLGPGGNEAIYSTPPSKHSFAHPASSRHSEGALQLARGANATHFVGELEGMEVASGREPLRYRYKQVVSPVDLNKSLPALPLQVYGQHGKE